MPTRKQFSELEKAMRVQGWVLSHSIMDESDPLQVREFGSCYLCDGRALYVNYLTYPELYRQFSR